MKKCSKCKQLKNLSEFGVDKKQTSGLTCQCKQCRKVALTKWNNSKEGQAYMRKWKYGLEPEAYELLKRKQKEKCAICKKETKLCVDHCHNSLVVRGLLCTHCNSILGHAFDNIETLENSIKYLKENQWAVK